MAEPDNVARLIASGSALGTACNMAVSYANYKRKRPRLSFSVDHGQRIATWDDMKVSPMWYLTLGNNGETPIKVHMVWLHWEPIPKGWKERILHRLWPRRNWRIRNGSGLTLASVQGLREPPEELPALKGFDCIYAGYLLEHDPDWLRNIAGTHLLRISVELPGNRWVHGPEMRASPECTTCKCAECRSSDGRSLGGQMTFDDLGLES